MVVILSMVGILYTWSRLPAQQMSSVQRTNRIHIHMIVGVGCEVSWQKLHHCLKCQGLTLRHKTWSVDPAYNYYVANYGVNVIFYTCEYENLNENLMSDDLYIIIQCVVVTIWG